MTDRDSQIKMKATTPEPNPEYQGMLSDFRASKTAFRSRLSVRPWWEVADALTAAITTTTQLCTEVALPMAEIKALWLSHLIAFNIVVELKAEWRSDPAEQERLHSIWSGMHRELSACGIDSPDDRTKIIAGMNDWYHRDEQRRLGSAIEAFKKALYDRSGNSPQKRYAEAQLASRRALMENHNPLLDGFPELVDTLRRICSQEAWTYVTEEIRPVAERYLDDPNGEDFLGLLHVIAHDRQKPENIENPPARVRLAARRRRERQRIIDSERYEPGGDADNRESIFGALHDERNLESSVIATCDWHSAQSDMSIPHDQVTAVNAKLRGFGLNSIETAEYLGWSPERLEKTRKSLEPDRRWGIGLRKRFVAYTSIHRPDWMIRSIASQKSPTNRTRTGFGKARWHGASRSWWFEFKEDWGGHEIGPFRSAAAAMEEAQAVFENFWVSPEQRVHSNPNRPNRAKE